MTEGSTKTDPIWELIFQSLPHPVVIMDLEHRILEMNPAARRAFTARSGELEGRKCHELFHASDAPPAGCPMEVLLSSGRLEVVEMEMETLQGTFLVTCIPIQDGKGGVSRIVHLATDITRKKKAERLLQLQNDLTMELADLSDIEDALGRILDACLSLDEFDCGGAYLIEDDPEQARLVAHRNLSAGFLEGTELYPLDSPQIRLARQGRIIASNYEKMGLPRSPKIQQEGLRGLVVVPILARGELLAIVNLGSHDRSVFSEVTQESLQTLATRTGEMLIRVRTQKALQESVTRFRELAELLPEIVFEIDKAGRLTFVNHHAYQLTGYSPEDLARGLQALELLVPEDQERARENIERILRGKHPLSSEYTARRKDGSTFSILVRSNRVIREGQPVGLRGIIMDLTERQEMEEQLRHASKMEAIGQLAGGIAHDFNNLLMGILGYSNLLRQELQEGTPSYQAAETIEKAARRAENLTQQLLGFARTGKHQSVPVDLHQTIQEVAALLGRTIDRNIRISLELQADHSTVRGDPGQLHQVLMNLALNARDAMESGGELTFQTEMVELTSSPHLTMTPGRYLQITLSDTGQGIPEANLDRIFDPFFTTKEPGRGTGMGLAMVYGIVKHHGGWIQVTSQVGYGSSFSLVLPPERVMVTPPDHSESQEPEPSSGRILVVDDEEVVRTVAASMLHRLGFEVLTATDGRQALDLYRKYRTEIDLVLLDLVMPEMDGADCFRALREIDPEVRVLLTTGYGLEGRAQELLAGGVLGFLQKPYTLVKLGEKLQQILTDRAS